MDESVEGIIVTENSLATPEPNTDVNMEIMNQAVQDTNVIENIDDTILEKTPAPNTEGDFEMVDLTAKDIALTENLVATSEPCTEEVDQKTEIKIENRETTFRKSTAILGEIMDQESEIINVIENLLATFGPIAKEVSEAMDLTAEDFKVNENLKSPLVSGTAVFSEIIDVMDQVTESLVVAPESRPEGINKTVDQATEDIIAIENIVVSPGPSTDGITEAMDQTTEDFKVTGNLKASCVSGTEEFNEIMDIDEDTMTESLTGLSSGAFNEIMNQIIEDICVIENSVIAPGSSTDEVSEAMNQTAEDFKVTENLKHLVYGQEAFTEIMDLGDDVSVTESLVPVLGWDSEGINEIMDQSTEDVSVDENKEASSVPSTERISEIGDKMDGVIGVTKHLDAKPVTRTGFYETNVPKENIINNMFDKEMNNNMENEVEKSKIMTGENKNLKIAFERKRKGLKRKIAHRSISEMVMDSIKSLKKDSGVSFEDIKTNMEENYSVNVTGLWKYHVINYLQKWVDTGILEKVDETDTGERFRIRENEIQL